MSSASRFTGNVPPAPEADKPKPTSVKFGSLGDQRVIEVAAALAGCSRSAFIVAAAVKAGNDLCAARGVDPAKAAA